MTETTEIQFFRSIQDSTDRNAWLDYLERYPQGDFRPIALQRISELSGQQSGSAAPAAAEPAKHGGRGDTAKGFVMAGALAGAIFGIMEFSSGIQSGFQTITTSFREATDPNFDPEADLEQRGAALIAAAFDLSGTGYSDDEAQRAISAALDMTSEEISGQERYLSAMEEIVDSFLSSERFDFAEPVEEKHRTLFRQDQRFFQSYVQSNGIMLLESTPRVSNDIWSIQDQAVFDRFLEAYREYATLDVVRKHWPEYDALYGAIIARLRGASEAEMSVHMGKVGDLNEEDLSSFMSLATNYATQSYKRSANAVSEIASQRMADLITNYAHLDASGRWRAVGETAGILQVEPAELDIGEEL